jgi:hypothetical protein
MKINIFVRSCNILLEKIKYQHAKEIKTAETIVEMSTYGIGTMEVPHHADMQKGF